MARSLPLVMVLVAVFFLALVPAPLVSGRIPIGKISVRLRPEQVTKVRNFLSKHAGDILDVVQEILQLSSPGDEKGAGDKAPQRAANTAGLYIFNLSVGTAVVPQNVAGVLDITLSFVWAQCEPCTSCLAAPSFRSKSSPTFATVPCASQTCQQGVLKQECAVASGGCGYTVNYRGGTNTTGNLASGTFTFGGPTSRVRVPGVLFGCSYASSGDFSGASASFGFGRGQLSLVSQLQLSWFSYHLASDGSGIGGGEGNLLQFGDDDDDAVPRSSQGRSTPLVHNSRYPGLYYVKLKGIQVDDRDLTGIPAGTFDLQADGSGGVFLSTTIPPTFLEEAAYKVVRQAFVNGIASKPVNGKAPLLCYKMPLKVPKLTLVFDGGATSTSTATMELKKSNYFLADSETGLECLTIMPSRGGSVLGSLLQTGTNMTYDISRDQLVFETAFAPTAFAPTAFAPPHYSKMSMSLMVLSPLVAWVLLF